jgi:hypothetical protein
MKRFILRTIKIIINPIILIFILYVCLDPCHVIWDFGKYPEFEARNAAFKSYKLLTFQDSIPYNSFIVGSSRSLNWPWEEWEKYLDSTAMAFHLDQSADGNYRALERLQYVYANVERVENVLLIVDHEFLQETTPPDVIQYRNPWQMKMKKDYFAFQLAALKHFLSEKGLKEFFRIGEDYRFILPIYTDERREVHCIGREWAIECDPQYYYSNLARQHIDYYKFPLRDSVEHVGEPVLMEENVRLLSEIHQLFVNGNTNYKIVVSPLYDQLKLNPQDKEKLDSIFGKHNVFDFSGINEFTKDSLNYYEASHYRPHVAKRLLEIIYTQ